MINENDFNSLKGWFWYEEAKVLTQAIESLKNTDGVIVEAGSYMGKSTVTMASCTDSLIYAIDPHLWDNSYDTYVKQIVGYNNIITVKEDAIDYKKSFDKPIKLLLIDCDHKYQVTKDIYKLYEPLVVKGGIIFFHDCVPTDRDFSNIVKTDIPIIGEEDKGAWYGPTIVLQEVKKIYPQCPYGARSLWGVTK